MNTHARGYKKIIFQCFRTSNSIIVIIMVIRARARASRLRLFDFRSGKNL